MKFAYIEKQERKTYLKCGKLIIFALKFFYTFELHSRINLASLEHSVFGCLSVVGKLTFVASLLFVAVFRRKLVISPQFYVLIHSV